MRQLSHLSDAARETIHRSVSQRSRGEAVPLAKVLREVRVRLPELTTSFLIW